MLKFPVSKPAFGHLEEAYLNAALASGQVTQGPMVQTFEDMLHEIFGQHVVACSTGTAALHLALAAADIGPGDEVLVPSLTYVATANAVLYTGATPVLVDVQPDTWCLDPADVVRKMSGKTRAVIPVHLYGVPADMATLNALCDEFGWWLIEDSAEALMSRYGSGLCGTLSDYGCFSFYGNKLITTGEGGCVVTSDAGAAARLRMLRGQGQSLTRRFYHEIVGFNYRMTDLQASIGVAQVAQMDSFISERREIFETYDAAFRSAMDKGDITTQSADYGHTASPWLYTLTFKNEALRDLVAARLLEKGIETRPTFVPLHRQPAFNRPDVQFPVSSKIGDCGISLPTFVGLGAKNATLIAETVLSALKPVKFSLAGASRS